MHTPPFTPGQPQTRSPFNHLPALIRFPQHQQCSRSLETSNDLVGWREGQGCPGAQAQLSLSCDFCLALSLCCPGPAPPPDENALSLPTRQGTDGCLRGKRILRPHPGNAGKRHGVMDVGRGRSGQLLGAPTACTGIICMSPSGFFPEFTSSTQSNIPSHSGGRPACSQTQAKGYLQ